MRHDLAPVHTDRANPGLPRRWANTLLKIGDVSCVGVARCPSVLAASPARRPPRRPEHRAAERHRAGGFWGGCHQVQRGPSTVHLRPAGRVAFASDSRPTWLQGESPYLLGPGLSKKSRQNEDDAWLVRRYLAPDTTIALQTRNHGKPHHADLFLAALWALCTFGGLGSRVRRGLGTVAIEKPEHAPELKGSAFQMRWLTEHTRLDVDHESVLPEVLAAMRTAVSGLGFTLPVGEEETEEWPRYPCFADGAALGYDERLRGAVDVGQALDCTGESYRQFREEVTKDGTAHSNALAGLGLPINYGDKGILAPDKSAGSRRASPLRLRVYRRDRQWRLRSLVLLAEFLPKGTDLWRRAVQERPSDAVIGNLLDRWLDRDPPRRRPERR